VEYRHIATIQARANGNSLSFPITPDEVNDHCLFPKSWAEQENVIMQYLAYTPNIIIKLET
jgi:hypothetical protein